MDRLQAMRVFMAVLDRRSLSAAAKALGLSLPTISRNLAQLEHELGVRLVARTTRGIAETDAGRLYYRRCQRILAELGAADAAAQSHAQVPAGELRVTAPVTFGRHHVAPPVAQFLERYPRLSVYLSLTDRYESLTEQRFDVAIRIAIVRIQGVAVRRLGYIQRVVVGSPDYFKRHPVPVHPQELAAHNCMHFTHYLRADEWNFSEVGQPVRLRVRGRMRADNQEALLEAVLAGAGMALLPTWLIQDELRDGLVQRVLGEFEAPRTPVYAVFPRRGPPPGKVRTFVDFLAERYHHDGILAPDSSTHAVDGELPDQEPGV